MWKLNSWYRGVRKSVTPSLRRPDLTWATSSQEKAELLSLTWFPPPTIITGQFAILADFHNPSSRPFIPISNKEIHDALSGTSNTSAPGLSGLNYQVLKWAFSSCPDEFGVIICASVKLGIHHSRWKSSLVVAIPKPNKKDYSLPRSHRPIQLIECFGKLVEKIVTKCLIFDAGKYDLMPFNQFGGRSNTSCLDAGLSLTHDINEAKHKGLVSSFLAIDIKGFFDHVNHKRMISVLWCKGFPPEICRWVSSFLSDRMVCIQIDDYTSPLAELKIGVPQGSPASPILSCLYSSEVIEVLNQSFICSSLSYPVSLISYIDDVGFLAISDSLGENVITLKSTLQTVQSLFTSIGMKIDPDKCDLMHFSNQRGDNSSPSLTSSVNGLDVTITPPKFIRWLGFYFNRKLTFNDHTKIMCARASNVVSGLSCLGNTIVGMTPQHLRLLFKMCVVPVMTYGCQLWYRPATPHITLMKRLQIVQNKGLRRIAGAFYTTPVESLSLLTFQPPIHITIRKLCDSTAICFFRLPLNSEISLRLPKSFIPSDHPSYFSIPKHIPFKRPDFIKLKTAISFLTSLASSIHPNTERSDPFHSHNAPYAFTSRFPLFSGRLFFDHEPCSKKNWHSLISEHNIFFINSSSIPSRLIIFTDGSHRDSCQANVTFYLLDT